LDDLKSSIVDHLNMKNKKYKAKAKKTPVTQSLNYVRNKERKLGLEKESLNDSKISNYDENDR